MNTIKMNFSEETHWVLQDESDKVVAIIVVPSGNVNITARIKQAIEEDIVIGDGRIEFVQDIIGDKYDSLINFSVAITEEDEEDSYITNFSLVKTAQYKIEKPKPKTEIKVAKLVKVSLMTRVIIKRYATEQEIMELAIPKLCENLMESPFENIDSIDDDRESPYDPEFDES